MSVGARSPESQSRLWAEVSTVSGSGERIERRGVSCPAAWSRERRTVDEAEAEDEVGCEVVKCGRNALGLVGKGD